MENYSFEDPSFETSRQYEFLQGIVSAIEAHDGENLSKVVRDNARIMSLDKANSKLLVEIKKLHCPEDGVPAQAMPASAAELDLVNGGDDIVTPARGSADSGAHPANEEEA